VGLARSGLAAVGLLRAQGAAVTACDARPLADSVEAPFILQADDAALGQQLVVISPGVPIDAAMLRVARGAGIPVVGELELASHFLRGPILAVTGSNGKTTTTSLCFHILRQCGIAAQVGGNIGTAAASLVDTSRDGQWNVLEVSSFQLESVERFQARIAVCLNLTPDHLDRHHDLATYAAAKGRLFDTQASDGFAVLNADDPACVDYGSRARGKVEWFSTSRAVDGFWHAGGGLNARGERFMEAGEIPLRGMHNVENALAAAAATHLAGAPLDGIRAAIRSFPGVEHRIEFVRRVAGVDYYNDSKATNVDATLKALAAFPGALWVILGGTDKGGDYAPLREPLRAKARAAMLVGLASPKIRQQVAGAVELVESVTIERAVEHARRHARPGDVVLLAPACASFDQFDNYEHRGRVFKALVNALEEGA
jgi:UDP-N-acetylmuramoylalanine--D-glutamate ligase